MKVALIAPLGMLHIAEALTDYHFVLPHLWNNELYQHFMCKSKKPKILDNGIYEGFEYTWKHLLAIAEELPNLEILVLPDFLGDYRRTKNAIEQALEIQSSYDFKLMVVPQADTLPNWIISYRDFEKYGDVIGFPIWMERKFGKFTRVRIAYLLHYTGDFSEKPHHLLGLDTPLELRYASKYFSSFDTSLPFSLAVQGLRIERTVPEHKRVNLERLEFSEEVLQLAYENVRRLLGFIRGRK